MTKDVIGWGILGTGQVAWDFAQGLSMVKSAKLCGIAGRSFEKVRHFAQSQRTVAYRSFEELLQDPAIDIVYIATPAHRHFADGCLALQNQKAILCEKPFAMNSFEAREIISLARRHQLFCMEAMWMRFMPLIFEVSKMVASGAIGAPMLISGDFAYPVSKDAKCHVLDPAAGGGALLDRGVYLLSLCHGLFGMPARLASQAQIGPTGVDEQCTLTLQYERGIFAQFSASLRTLGTNEVTIMGESGTIKIHAPFYKPHKISITPFKTQPPLRTVVQATTSPYVHSARKVATSQPLASLVSALGHGLRGTRNLFREKTRKHMFLNGYQFEAYAATHCLQSHLLESPVMPHQHTLDVMHLLDIARQSQKNGGVFECIAPPLASDGDI